jgi:hypothetical protein
MAGLLTLLNSLLAVQDEEISWLSTTITKFRTHLLLLMLTNMLLVGWSSTMLAQSHLADKLRLIYSSQFIILRN